MRSQEKKDSSETKGEIPMRFIDANSPEYKQQHAEFVKRVMRRQAADDLASLLALASD